MSQSQQLYEQAVAAFNARRFDDVITLTSQAISLTGFHPVLGELLGKAEMERKNYARAIEYFRDVLVATPESAAIKLSLLRAFYLNCDWENVAQASAEVLKGPLDPLVSITISNWCGVALHHLGRADESQAQFKLSSQWIDQHRLLEQKDKAPSAFAAAVICALGMKDLPAIHDLLALQFPQFFTQARAFKISKATTLAEWRKAANPHTRVLSPAQNISIDMRAEGSGRWNYTADEFSLVSVPGAEMISGWDYVIAPTGEVLEGSGYSHFGAAYAFMPHLHFADLGLIAHVWSESCVEVAADALFLSTPESYHFGDWLVDFLPRLRAWQVPGEPKLKIAIPTTLPRKHREMLACFGVMPEDLIECELGKRYRFKSLTVVQHGNFMRPKPESVRFIYNAMAAEREPAPKGSKERHLFMLRDVGTRLIANQGEVDGLLAECGFEYVNLAKLSIVQQRELLPRAGIILGVFGTELLCFYQARPGTDIVELTWDSNEDPVIGPSCAMLDIHHQFLVCAEAQTSTKVRMKKDREIVVDCAALRQRLEAIIKRRSA